MAKNLSQRLKILSDSKKTVFRTEDLREIWQDDGRTTVIAAGRMVNAGLILRLATGYYALNEEYNIYELANLLVSPSYVSFNSALFFAGVCFQISDVIESAAGIYRMKTIGGRAFKYHALKKEILYNTDGINMKNNISIAGPERAILDTFYFGLHPNIDDRERINRTYLKRLSEIYPKSVRDKIKELL